MRENLKFLLDAVGPERVRVKMPHIPGYNTEKDWNHTIEQLKQLGVTEVEELVYLTGQLSAR